MSLDKNKYLTIKDLKALGFKKIGKNPKIGKRAIFYNTNISIGNNVRIDDTCILKGKIKLGHDVHLAHGSIVAANYGEVSFNDFCNISVNCLFFTNSDDYIKPYLPSATLNKRNRKIYSKIHTGDIKIGKACLIGAGSVLLPGAKMNDYSSIGALTVLHKEVKKGYYFSSYNNKLVKRDWQKIEEKIKKYYKTK